MLCQYRSIFGDPNTGLHKIRFLNIAIIDLLLTILFAWLYSKYYHVDFINIVVILILFGIICHYIFCVNTTINILLFGTKL